MTPPPVDFDGWKSICGVLGRSENWCREMARRSEDPLPVHKVGGMVRLTSAALAAWLKRQEARRYGCEAGCDDAGAP